MAKKPGHPHNFRALSKPKPIRKAEHRHYLPYIPVLLLIIATILVSVVQPAQKRGVLAYATSVSTSDLLTATNRQRQNNQARDLTLNSELSAAAQAKANDMVARNYWSHNTPEGQEPWVFINTTGYKYQKAGENLAYGFATSKDTVTGWMNSPPHRENLLDKDFTEVGFGFANSSNYNNSGNETIVVAMYGRPQVLGVTEDNNVIPLSTNESETAAQNNAVPVATNTSSAQNAGSKIVTRAETLTGGRAPWIVFSIGLMTGIALVLLLAKHMAGLRHVLKDGEKFILHHPLLDTILVSIVLLGSFLSQTTGIIL